MFNALTARAQKWLPGSFTDNKGNTETGFVRIDPPGKAPVKTEAFIEFRENEKMNPIKLSAGELRSVKAGIDSFLVAYAPGNQNWNGKELDFVKVVLDEDIKLYLGKGSRGGGFGITPGLSGGFGAGSGTYGGVGGGVGIALGGRGGKSKTMYYFGANTAEMQPVSPANFNDIMSDIMIDEPEVVEQIRMNKYNLGNIEKLIEYYNKSKASRQQ
ncbi:hypothetical protein [Mucilaginibacter hurinus]|uniref:hypothetical protein n=1 Tax=Mucilaginibacter hurinus TaxID=2201324 RepID=UPI0011BF93D7|nr:hypothetical protein [Mucilaginibacter hurinus]